MDIIHSGRIQASTALTHRFHENRAVASKTAGDFYRPAKAPNQLTRSRPCHTVISRIDDANRSGGGSFELVIGRILPAVKGTCRVVIDPCGETVGETRICIASAVDPGD